jgi:hypothetical protein
MRDANQRRNYFTPRILNSQFQPMNWAVLTLEQFSSNTDRRHSWNTERRSNGGSSRGLGQ